MADIDLTTHQAVENGVRLTRAARKMIRDVVRIREYRGYTSSDVADSIGINRSGITRFEHQEASPRLDTILRYAHTVGASISFTVERCEELEERLGGPRRVTKRTLWSETVADELDSSVRPDTEWAIQPGNLGRKISMPL